MAASVAEYNINVNAICPGQVWTAFHEPSIAALKAQDDSLAEKDSHELFAENALDLVPMGREQTPEEIGSLVAFLASRRREFHHGPVDSHRRRAANDLTAV